MARSEARLYAAIWDDEAFLAVSPLAQRLYMFLISQKDLTHTGVIPLRAQRWSRKGLGLRADEIERDLEELRAHRFVIVDWDTGEVLVRSLVRRDKVYRQPNVMKAAIDYIPLIESQAILRALAAELVRIRDEDTELSKPMVDQLEAMERALAERVVPDQEKAARNPSGNPSQNPSEKASGKRPRGTGSVTTVTTDSPFPDSPLIPLPAGDASPPPRAELVLVTDTGPVEPGPEPRTAQEILGWFIDETGFRPPNQVIGPLAKTIKSLLDQKFEPIDIRRGLIEWAGKELHPSSLPSVVSAIKSRGAPIRAAPTQMATTDRKILAGQQLAAQLRALEGGQR